MNLIWQTSLELLELQCTLCGIHTISPGTLKFVYQSCAMAGGQWKAALIVTEHLFNHQKRSSLSSSLSGLVRSDHCSLYCSLFGWEKALEFWGTNFPQCMLREVSGNYRAVDYCMRLSE
ncbi:uncharacterized protein TM35_000441690 [Trypanosoma theileri]|uniref:Uncharacterized protein n=1 Tax=Trypanosoma theileri TaxID=67003 RepID=A0A1X0NJ67_9TRYP|nr:uncharacterized protein TM35_000441690 [Trypanosoma theileri]ORC84513.1 hypothetical protein TM35_000441690 [Trypanosoma theileri]